MEIWNKKLSECLVVHPPYLPVLYVRYFISSLSCSTSHACTFLRNVRSGVEKKLEAVGPGQLAPKPLTVITVCLA